MQKPQPLIKSIPEKQLVGISVSMSFAENKTAELWQHFIPRIKEINQRSSENKVSMQLYDTDHFLQFNPTKKFTKWAAVEVEQVEKLPEGMESILMPGGLYAIFHYKGSSNDPNIFQYIFSQWLPSSGYQLDDRPHFEILGERYKNNDPNSEEDIYIPIR